MKVQIEKINRILGSDYNIIVDGKKDFHVSWKSGFKIKDRKDQIQLTVKKKWNIFRLHPKLLIANPNTKQKWILDFNGNSEYYLINDNRKINFYEQVGRKVGLFADKTQIGYFDKQKSAKMGNNKYYLIIDNNLEYLPIIATVIAYDRYFSSNNSDTFKSYDYGNINIEPKQTISSKWKPK
ncbi:hypothetical protein [Carboxylicivirga taeanensis]|uniref:hypothetical protein n=1 Tax=Carboxylicivirga taeanensis TaxID=1416875 RepID=UPI003F6E0F11